MSEVGIGGVACLHHRGERVAVLLQPAEGLGDVGDQGLVERRQGSGERGGERALVRALGELGRTDLDEQIDQGAVALLAEGEQRLVDRPPVGARGSMHGAVRADRVLQAISSHGDLGAVDERQVLADALVGNEEPVRRRCRGR